MGTLFSKKLKQLRTGIGLTQAQLADTLGVGKSTISMYEVGAREPDFETAQKIAEFFHTDMHQLISGETHPLFADGKFPGGLRALQKIKRVPKVGRIACGTPILAVENIEEQVVLPDGVHADFALDCKGDSMVDANIFDGDTVFIRMQPEVENGEIAAVLIGDEATLKRVYKKSETLTLMPANASHEPLVFCKEEMNGVRVIGRATAVLRML